MKKQDIFAIITLLLSSLIFILFVGSMAYTLYLMFPITTLSELFLSLNMHENLLLSRIITVSLSLRFGLFETVIEWLEYFYNLIGSLTFIEVAAIATLPLLYGVVLFMEGKLHFAAERLISLWGDILTGIVLLLMLSIIMAFFLWPYPSLLFSLIKVIFALLILYWIYRFVSGTKKVLFTSKKLR